MANEEQPGPRLHEKAVFQGFLFGLVAGALVWLWRLPLSGHDFRAQLFGAGKELRAKLTPPDPVAESLAEGKALARHRREAQGTPR